MKRGGPLKTFTALKRYTPIKARRDKPRRGPILDEPYKRWIRTQRCCAV